MKTINRREFGEAMLTFLVANLLVSCGGSSQSANPLSPPPVPLPQAKSLLERVIDAGHTSAQRVTNEKFPGASQIAIRGDLDWNFLVGDSFVLLSASTTPNADVAAMMIPHNSVVEIRSF